MSTGTMTRFRVDADLRKLEMASNQLKTFQVNFTPVNFARTILVWLKLSVYGFVFYGAFSIVCHGVWLTPSGL
jgi:hypothetical protein